MDWERLNTKIDKIPQTLADFLVDIKVSEFIDALAQKYIQLSVQGPDMARLIRDVVIRDIFIGDIPKEISDRLGVDQTLAREIANLIISQLFTPIIEDIKKVQNERYPGRLPAQSQVSGVRVQGSGQSGQDPKPVAPPSYAKASEGTAKHYQGEELPESGGNIIDLRSKS